MTTPSEPVLFIVHTRDDFFVRTVSRRTADEWRSQIRNAGANPCNMLCLPEETRLHGVIAHEAHVMIREITHIVIERCEDNG